MNDDRIRIPALDDPDAMKDAFYAALDELCPAMDLSVNDARATVDEVTITDVDLDAESVRIAFEFEWSSYYGCKDIDSCDTGDGEIVGVLQEGFWVFERFVPPTERNARRTRSSDHAGFSRQVA
ncbi:hypothetical protein [Hydrogenophaga palleronii]|uniref:hypothetical protein n=1 Tax=Hydrogenophaga palleronii TaxID=65655 RepID=UPI000826E483|nr:hypothetical protein [Hydrogenophaga palleronii]